MTPRVAAIKLDYGVLLPLLFSYHKLKKAASSEELR